MGIVVQKFGGTSVRTSAARDKVCDWVEGAIAAGETPVVVVSAMGRRGDPYATDTLLAMLEEAGPLDPEDRDLYLACGEILAAGVVAGHLARRGLKPRIFTGGGAGIITDDRFGDARIISLEAERLERALGTGWVPVVAGFQGVTRDGRVTTLGRGGSDTTAVALGAALKAERVDIFTDVDGIKTADPRLVPEARTIAQMDYEEVFQLAHLGARVIHPRAVELGRQFGVVIRVRSTFSEADGTWIVAGPPHWDPWGHRRPERAVTGITHLDGLAQVEVTPGEQASPYWALELFQTLGREEISVDLINVFPDRTYFCVPDGVASATEAAAARLGHRCRVWRGKAKVSIIGSAIQGLPGVMGTVMQALAEAGVEVLQSSDSHSTISVLVNREAVQSAVNALHRQFGLGEGGEREAGPMVQTAPPAPSSP